MTSGEGDPHVVLERLHGEWAAATEATEIAWETLKADPLNQSLRDDYYAKQEASNRACQAILVHKHETGI